MSNILGSLRLVQRVLTRSIIDSLLMAEVVANTSSAAKPVGSSADNNTRKFLPLSHLNEQSARVGLWEVMIYNPKENSHTYLWEGKERKSHGFQCTLVSTQDPKQYILADSHGKGVTESIAKALLTKFKPGLVFSMSKVVLATNTKRQFNSAPKSEIVCMRQSKFDPVLAVSAGKPDMPEPPVPIAASMSIDHEQQFDALALIQNISEAAPGGQLKDGRSRIRFTITLLDGSKKKDEEKPRRMPVTIFANKPSDNSDPLLLQELRNEFKKQSAVAFFNIQGKKSESPEGSTWSFTSGLSFAFKVASRTTKGAELESKATELLAADTEIVPETVLQSRSVDNENYADKEATETTCALLKTLLTRTNIAAVEVDASFWQINRCRVYLPDMQELRNADGTRLWFRVKVEDETGHITLFIREKAALSLAAMDSKEDFENAIANETLSFPLKASIKVIRKSTGIQTPIGKSSSVEKPTEEDGKSQDQTVRCYIVEAAEQDMHYAPSKRSFELITLLSMTDPDTNVCVPAVLSAITKDPHYGLSVSYTLGQDTITKRCTKAIALVVASKPTVSDNVNDGYQMITDDVRDPFTEDFTCKLLSYCTVKASPDYQLKPNRGQKSQTAFVCIVDVLEHGDHPLFLVEHMEKVEDSETTRASEHMGKRIEFAAMSAQMQGTSANRTWTETQSPATAGKCRRIGKAPSSPVA